MKKHINPFKADLPVFTYEGIELFEPAWLDEGAMFKALNMIQREVPDLTHLSIVKDMVVEWFQRLGIKTEEIDYASVEYNSKSSAGALVDHRNKGDYMTREAERDLLQFHEYANELFPLDKGTLKSEIVKIIKRLEKDTRYFQFPNAPTFFYGAKYCQSFNKQLYEVGAQNNTCIAPGIGLFNGGLDSLARRLNKKKHIIEADCRKYDKKYQREFHDACRDIRIALIDAGGNVSEITNALNNIYRWVCRDNFTMLPTGQVLKIIDSMKSGFVNTTTDNTITHILIWFLYWYRQGYTTLDQILEVFEAALYSDDQLAASDEEIEREKLLEHYKSLGFELKPEMKIQDDVVGLTFLGFTIKEYKGSYVGVFDRNKLNFILHIDKSAMTVQQHFDKAIAVLLLGRYTYTRKERAEIRTYMTKLKEFGALGDILNDRQLDYFWSGLETGGEGDAIPIQRHKELVEEINTLLSDNYSAFDESQQIIPY